MGTVYKLTVRRYVDAIIYVMIDETKIDAHGLKNSINQNSINQAIDRQVVYWDDAE